MLHGPCQLNRACVARRSCLERPPRTYPTRALAVGCQARSVARTNASRHTGNLRFCEMQVHPESTSHKDVEPPARWSKPLRRPPAGLPAMSTSVLRAGSSAMLDSSDAQSTSGASSGESRAVSNAICHGPSGNKKRQDPRVALNSRQSGIAASTRQPSRLRDPSQSGGPPSVPNQAISL